MKDPNITIVDYGVGNVYSVLNAIKHLGYKNVQITSVKDEILTADCLILPGVGAFKACIDNLHSSKLINVLTHAVIDIRTPILGICVGMQLMADSSEENGQHSGLGWIPGKVIKIPNDLNHPVPHVGWNNLIRVDANSPLFTRSKASPHFYFDHSYVYSCDEKYITSTFDYNGKHISSISLGNIHGVQFHPEKSSLNGLRLFRSFFSSF